MEEVPTLILIKLDIILMVVMPEVILEVMLLKLKAHVVQVVHNMIIQVVVPKKMEDLVLQVGHQEQLHQHNMLENLDKEPLVLLATEVVEVATMVVPQDNIMLVVEDQVI